MTSTADCRPWSEAETAYLRAHRDDPFPELCAMLPGRSTQGIRNKIKNIGLQRTRVTQTLWPKERQDALARMFKDGLSDEAIGKALNATEKAVACRRREMGYHRERASYRLSREQTEKLEQLRSQGTGYLKIARLIGAPSYTVTRYIDRNRIYWECPESPEHERKDAEFVARLIGEGGMPRFREDARHNLMPGWCDEYGRPWAGLRRQLAA